MKLYAKFNGHNHRTLARAYGITETRVRQIIAAIERERASPRPPEQAAGLDG